jgi:hypothetical protein
VSTKQLSRTEKHGNNKWKCNIGPCIVRMLTLSPETTRRWVAGVLLHPAPASQAEASPRATAAARTGNSWSKWRGVSVIDGIRRPKARGLAVPGPSVPRTREKATLILRVPTRACDPTPPALPIPTCWPASLRCGRTDPSPRSAAAPRKHSPRARSSIAAASRLVSTSNQLSNDSPR